ncbi:hypothetical protein LCGC14_2952200, partial [marine sediment metagenome]
MEPAEPGGFAIRFEIPEQLKDSKWTGGYSDDALELDSSSLRKNQL